MSFHLSPLKSKLQYGKQTEKNLNEYFVQVVPSEKLLSELPFSKNLDIRPFHGSSELCNFFLEAILDFDIQSSDVFVCSLAKCGSSWTQTIAWLLTHGLDYKAAESMDRLNQMGDFDEMIKMNAAREKAREILANDPTNSITEEVAYKMGWNEVFRTMDTPRIIKSHNQVYLLPKKIWQKGAKVIYVVRNPKDMIVSAYHYERNVFQLNSSLDESVDSTTNDMGFCAPHLNHILNFWRVRHLPNVLFVAYEDLVQNSFATMKKISEFLECKYTDDQLQELTEYVSFDQMKKNKALNREADIVQLENLTGIKRPDSDFKFLRKGKVGGFRDDLTEEQIKKIDNWIEKGVEGTDFRFKM